MHLATFDPAAFLRDHWQKTPLLIRSPWTAWANPLDPDDLAALACDETSESRIVRHTKSGLKVEHGPFEPKRFAKAGKRQWTLLVQAVDHAVPEVAALLDAFRFVPNWRVDDVMVSHATDGGGVGPHFDQYDVFLIQGLGQRRWKIGPKCDATTDLAPNDDLRLIADFAPTEEWVLNPGDILYLPPGIAHDGVAVGGDCMTYSIGFRAPSRSELIGGWADDLLAGLRDDDRYADPGLTAPDNPGEIAPAALDRLHAMVTEALADRAAFARWFGRHASAPKYPEIDWSPDAPLGAAALRAALAAATTLNRNPASRFGFIREGETVFLFVDGEEYACTGPAAALAARLAAASEVTVDAAAAASPEVFALLAMLLERGSVAFAGSGM